MKQYRSEFSVERMAGALEVSRSGFYAWLRRQVSRRSLHRQAFDARLRGAFEASKQRSGSRKLCRELALQGQPCERKRVVASMRRQGLRCIVARKFRVVTTDSKHDLPVAANLLDRQFSVAAPNRAWVSDITYLPSRNGWLYLCVFIDLFSRLVVGWSVGTSLGRELVLTALQRAIARRRPPPGLLAHTDRGSQYCSADYRQILAALQAMQSMSRSGNCWDNAVAESFFRSLKTELIYHTDLLNVVHAEQELREYIDDFYCCRRLHATLGYVSPLSYELRACAKAA
jgi:transposase InsO family protein